MKYIILDVETGGFEINTSLLSISCAVTKSLDHDEKQWDWLNYFVKPNSTDMDDCVLKVTPGALRVNNFSRLLHNWHNLAETYEYVSEMLLSYLQRHKGKDDEKLVLIGHNVRMDLKFIHGYLIDKHTWDKYVRYRALDTATIARYLVDCKKLPEHLASADMSHLASYFGLDVSEAHTARGDVKIAFKLYKKLVQCVKS